LSTWHRASCPRPKRWTAIDLLANAQRPLVVLGKGAAYAQADEQIREFIESNGLPFQPMSMATGLLPDNHPQSVATTRSLALRRADVVIAGRGAAELAARPWRGATVEPRCEVHPGEIEPTELDSNQPIAAPLVGDIGSVMDALLERTAPGQITAPASWREELAARSAQNIAKTALRGR
jgi:oxalyl-CoA decarboxylase